MSTLDQFNQYRAGRKTPFTLADFCRRTGVNMNTARRATNGMADYLQCKNGVYQRVFVPEKTSVTI